MNKIDSLFVCHDFSMYKVKQTKQIILDHCSTSTKYERKKWKDVQKIRIRNRVALNVYYETDTTSPDT